MNAILQVENLTKQYADFKLDHVSFSVPKGTIMGLIGENGAGKSTTINAILDLIHKDDGTVTFWGQELSSTKQIKEDVGVVFDGNYICLFNYLFISSQMSAKPYFIGSTGILLLW